MSAIGLSGGNSSLTNLAGGLITGQFAVYFTGGNNTLDNAGTITATFYNAISMMGGGIVNNQAGGILNATGTTGAFGICAIAGNSITIANAGTINASSGIVTQSAAGPAVVSNSGSINASDTAVWAYSDTIDFTNSGSVVSSGNGVVSSAGGTIVNNGSINATGYQISVGAAFNITNQAGGTITGNRGAIALAGTDLITLTLDQQSVTNGNIVSTASGTRNVNVAGGLNGNYDAQSGTGSDTVVLAATGSIDAIDLGGGDDSLNSRGNALTGPAVGGSGTDVLSFDIAGSAAFDAACSAARRRCHGWHRNADADGHRHADRGLPRQQRNPGSLRRLGAQRPGGPGYGRRLDNPHRRGQRAGPCDQRIRRHRPWRQCPSHQRTGQHQLLWDYQWHRRPRIVRRRAEPLRAATSYTGLTQVSGGTLQLGADNAISDASTVLVGFGASST